MSWETAANTIRARFQTQIADVRLVPTFYDNAPSGPIPDEMHVRFSVLFGDTEAPTIGGTRFRTTGIADAGIFILQANDDDAGDGAGLELADAIKTAFRAVTDGDVRFRSPSVTRVGQTGRWHHLSVTCPFWFDEEVA